MSFKLKIIKGKWREKRERVNELNLWIIQTDTIGRMRMNTCCLASFGIVTIHIQKSFCIWKILEMLWLNLAIVLNVVY
jgi:hypothetical protein